MNRRNHVGFTLVELLVVIVVVALISSITATLYLSAQTKARDTSLREAGNKFADAVQLFIARNGHYPRGGVGSSAGIGSNQECQDGSNGFAGPGIYLCSVEDTLVASQYLPAGFSKNLPKNTRYQPTSAKNLSLMSYTTGTNSALVMYTLEASTDDDKAAFDDELSRCGINPSSTYAPRDTYGMRAGRCILY